jgi:hypothetical protein
LICALAAAALLWAGGASGGGRVEGVQDPSFTVRYDSAAAHRPVIRIGSVLDDAGLEQATTSGLPVRIRVRVELWRDGWIDDLEASQSWDAVLLYEPLERQYIVRPETGPARYFVSYQAARRAIEGDHPLDIRPRREGRFYYTATMEIETLALSDLEELERWLQGELQPAVTGKRSVPGAVGQGAKRIMIRLLGLPTRRLEAKTEKFRIR